MVEDTSVNTGVTVWPDENSAYEMVRRMQTKLHRWAVSEPDRRFDDLYNLVYDPAFLVHAFERVAGNVGAKTPGIDKVTVTYIRSRVGVGPFLDHVQALLKSGAFVPVPVRRVEIPKTSGKVRRLGIPTVTDRVVQAALKLVLEPIFEADFLPCSYGFRPNRRAQDAVAEIQHLTTRGYTQVLEADIRACFDMIDHTALLGRVRARIKDKKLVSLVRAFLKAGVMTGSGDHVGTLTGTPQGGILSPLLANIALSALDEHFDREWKTQMGTWHHRNRRRKQGLGSWKLIRYADDFVICVNGTRDHAEALRAVVAGVIAPLGLRLAEEKTRVVNIDEGFDFLGFTIRRMVKRGTGKSFVYTVPSKKSIRSITLKVRELTSRKHLHLGLDQLLVKVARVTRGWANYFRHAVSKDVFNAVQFHAWRRVGKWIKAKHGRISWRRIRGQFCDIGWRWACNGVVFRSAASVAVTRYRYRGAQIPTPWSIAASTPATSATG
ncbi:group II intron reverse transcriptase/maturase [Arthrobacter sp. SDTb3-6]|uniref:group II intron reverse transcriptase/maturase n=1 Tax=Arthrobacter sp. SDTb3-6 TaxID=2713571 RepID=UPI00159E62A7|nr:group II intron reverse transcriptase/maturase [Arthrobacter sp. SDTb3-6]NVN00807.1 group II intron reverse transcriptase/maturase [Arthrobacter sp. SDTb3-6]